MKKRISLLVLSLLVGLGSCANNNDNSSQESSSVEESTTSEKLSSVLSSEELTSEITSELSSVTTSSEETSNIISNISSEIISNVTSEQNSQTSIEDTTSEEESSDVSTSENQTTSETPVTSENTSAEESSEEESSEEITSNTPTTSEEVSSEIISESTSEEESGEIISSEEISSIVSESISSEVSSIVTSESISQVTSDITTSIIESIESSDIVTSEEESSEEVTSYETTSENTSSEESSEEESSEEITSNTPTTSEEVSSETTSEITSEEVSSETTSEEESSEESSTPEEIIYDEPLDSVEGVDVTDLSALKEAFDNWGINYKKHSKTYFNDLALEIVNEIYNTYYIQDKITLCHENYRYVYNEEDSVNEAYFNLPGYLDLFKVPLYGDTLEERFESVINSSGIESSQLIDNISNYFIGGEDFSSEYVDKYGPKDVAQSGGTTKHYDGWTRISENKYKCDRLEVINDILKVVAPDFTNGGTYMTFRYVTIELNPMNDADMRIRLYSSPTQSGKMLEHHLDQENKPNWYLLFAEALISNIGETSIPAIENLLAAQQPSE